MNAWLHYKYGGKFTAFSSDLGCQEQVWQVFQCDFAHEKLLVNLSFKPLNLEEMAAQAKGHLLSLFWSGVLDVL